MTWTDARASLPEQEGRYLIVYRYRGTARIEKAYIGDWYIDGTGRGFWNCLPRDCDVIFWQPIEPWPAPLECLSEGPSNE